MSGRNWSKLETLGISVEIDRRMVLRPDGTEAPITKTELQYIKAQVRVGQNDIQEIADEMSRIRGEGNFVDALNVRTIRHRLLAKLGDEVITPRKPGPPKKVKDE